LWFVVMGWGRGRQGRESSGVQQKERRLWRKPRATSPTGRSMPEEAASGEHHGDTVLIRCSDDLGVAD
jgi:hypothetical protein